MFSLCCRRASEITTDTFSSQERVDDDYYGELATARKRGVIGDLESGNARIVVYEKSEKTKELIKDAILKNKFLQDLDEKRIGDLISTMRPKTVVANSRIIHEGEIGTHLYVSEEGTFEICIGNVSHGAFGPGVAFGELALLYETKRLCSIDANTNGKVWTLDRSVFRSIMAIGNEKEMEHSMQLLRKIPIFNDIPDEALVKITDLIAVEFYPANVYVIKQDDYGSKFYIVNAGSVKVTINSPGGIEKEMTILNKGDYFGEKALYEEESCRKANVIAMSPGVECYTIERSDFLTYLGGLNAIKNKNWLRHQKSTEPDDWSDGFKSLTLSDLMFHTTIGVGGCSRVELVTVKSMPDTSFARKKIKKHTITKEGFQKMVYNEKMNLRLSDSPFVCRLHRTFKDKRYLYFLLEVCLGGDLRTALYRNGRFDNKKTRFVVACVVEGLNHLHSLGIVYRDLKPENVVIDGHGYAKLVSLSSFLPIPIPIPIVGSVLLIFKRFLQCDLGASKYIGGYKTGTFIGTPEYLAPEIIHSKAYSRAVDYWALGIVTYELLLNRTPFQSINDLETYNNILLGFKESLLPPAIKSAAKSFIVALLQEDPTKRLGCLRNGVDDIRGQRWFHNFKWQDFQQRNIPSPIVPTIKGHLDVRNFDRYPPDHAAAPNDFADWDATF
ncbi:cGMP-dependent protein kinase 1 isoform X1 [Megalopta genalis]|uniref:cGMP-dependent protein kinase 1 isoform X1 n=1 Tax=Megalopta genalis TaxID=115081 RepID=UPI003FD68BE3